MFIGVSKNDGCATARSSRAATRWIGAWPIRFRGEAAKDNVKETVASTSAYAGDVVVAFVAARGTDGGASSDELPMWLALTDAIV